MFKQKKIALVMKCDQTIIKLNRQVNITIKYLIKCSFVVKRMYCVCIVLCVFWGPSVFQGFKLKYFCHSHFMKSVVMNFLFLYRY